jgi:predicted Zn-ribbon and HTH transcriptional regulator
MSTELQNNEVAALSQLPPSLAIMKMENDTIQALATARPRDYSMIKKDLAEQLEMFPILATEAIYQKPVGREDDICKNCGSVCFRDKKTKKRAFECWKCKSKDIAEGAMKFAEGLSIRSAETLAEVCGYNRVRSDVTPLDATTVKVEATYTDYQRGRLWQDGGIVSKLARGRDGQVYTIDDDRFYNVVLKAEKSKYVREVIVRSLPAGLKAWWREECERLAEKVLDDETVQKIVNQFASKQVSLEHLEALLGKTIAKGWTKQDRQILVGVWTAIRDGETTVYEVFDIEPPKPKNSAGNGGTSPGDNAAGTGTVTGADLTKPKATEQPKDELPKEQPAPKEEPLDGSREAFFADIQRRYDDVTSMGKFLSLNKEIAEQCQGEAEQLRHEGIANAAKERIRKK